ncbi:AAA family ATPase [Campylobacter sp. RM16191]|uniref:AAA family ATPase n=1 Tax=Campylobacter sp. RM16191 TaxID=1705728 RepID=UPI0014756D72|nr:AAA family ATPase [Campylobacter sp. RM16191]
MSRFEFLNAPSIEEISKLDERQILIDDFLLEKSINIIWGKSGLGKTWLCFSVAKYLSSLGFDSVYIDADNGIDLIKDRGYDKIIKELDNKITYINADFMDDAKSQMNEIFKNLEENASKGYEKALFILDSLSFFLGDDVYDEAKIHKLISFCKRIRRAGGTIIIIAHATKAGSNIRGSSSLINSVDEVWEASTEPSKSGELNFVLNPYKQRLNVKKTAFNIMCNGCILKKVEPSNIEVDEKEFVLIEKIKELLKDGELNQNKIYKALEISKGDRATQRVLERFDGIFWQRDSGGNKSIVYKLI